MNWFLKISAALALLVCSTQANGQTFNSVAECREYSKSLFTQVVALGREESECMKGPSGPFDHVEQCGWDNDGPFVTSALTAWPQCKSIDVQQCGLEIEKRKVDALCQEMASQLEQQMKGESEEIDEALSNSNFMEYSAITSLSEQLVQAKRFQNASGRPKTLLLGTYFDGKLEVESGHREPGGTDDRHLYEHSVSTWPTAEIYERILGHISGKGPSHTKYIDEKIRSIFPSFEKDSTVDSPLDSSDLERINSLIKYGTKGLLSRNPAIKAIQKDTLDAILQSHTSLLLTAEQHWNSFETTGQDYYGRISAVNEFTDELEGLIQLRRSRSVQTSPGDDICDGDGFNACAALGGLLQGMANAATQSQQNTQSGGAYGEDDCGGRRSTGEAGEGRC